MREMQIYRPFPLAVCIVCMPLATHGQENQAVGVFYLTHVIHRHAQAVELYKGYAARRQARQAGEAEDATIGLLFHQWWFDAFRSPASRVGWWGLGFSQP